jgi:hypothetical protein
VTSETRQAVGGGDRRLSYDTVEKDPRNSVSFERHQRSVDLHASRTAVRDTASRAGRLSIVVAKGSRWQSCRRDDRQLAGAPVVEKLAGWVCGSAFGRHGTARPLRGRTVTEDHRRRSALLGLSQ